MDTNIHIKYGNLPKAMRISYMQANKNFALIPNTGDILDYDKYLNKEIYVVGKLENRNGNNHISLHNPRKRSKETLRLIRDLKFISKKEHDLKRLKEKLKDIYTKKHKDFIKEEEKEFAPDGPGYSRALKRFTQRAKSKSRARSLPLSIKKISINTHPKSAPSVVIKKTPKSKSPSKSPSKSKKYKLKIVDKFKSS